LPQPALHHHAVPAGQGLGDVLGGVAPDGASQEQGVPVAPLPGLPVEHSRRGGDGEVGDDRADGVKRSSGSAVRLPTTVVIVSFAMMIRSFR